MYLLDLFMNKTFGYLLHNNTFVICPIYTNFLGTLCAGLVRPHLPFLPSIGPISVKSSMPSLLSIFPGIFNCLFLILRIIVL